MSYRNRKILKFLLNHKNSSQGNPENMPGILAGQEAEVESITVEGQPRAGSIVQVVKHLLAKHMVLSSNPSTTGGKGERERERQREKERKLEAPH
jgi:hypothetical protein